MLNTTFTATIVKDDEKSGWTCVVWPESANCFGTRKPVKVTATIDGHDFQATFLPFSDSTHMLPLKAAIRTAIKKQVGDTVYEEAEAMLQRALAISEKVLGKDHPGTATTLHLLARVYVHRNKNVDAVLLYQRALEIRERKLRPEHPDIVTTLENYAYLLRKMSREKDADALEERSNAIRAKQLS